MRRSGDLKGSAWVSNGALLAAGAALPSLLLASNWQQVSDLGPLYQTLALVLVDAVFVATATAFLSGGDKFGLQRYGDTPPYPGPFIEKDGKSFPPAYFKAYVTSTPLSLGIFAPTAGLGYLTWQGQSYLAACTIGVYLLEVAAQLISEGQYIKQKTAMWPQVPQVYQTYRIWQLIRGCYIVDQFAGPRWLWYLQAMLILLWTFNFGAVMTWTPWMYRWHLQPEDAVDRAKQEVNPVLQKDSSKNK